MTKWYRVGYGGFDIAFASPDWAAVCVFMKNCLDADVSIDNVSVEYR